MSRFQPVKGFCPACGTRNLHLDHADRIVCRDDDCSDPDAAAKILADSEIEHIVRFDDSGYFNAQHPLRERVDGALLDCAIHDEVCRWYAAGGSTAPSTWRVRRAGEHDLDANWVWEPIT